MRSKLKLFRCIIGCVAFLGILFILTVFPGRSVDSVVTIADEEEEEYANCQAVIKDYNISMSNYVMAISYREQLTMATDSFSALVNLARGLQSRVVTPFTHNSELYGLPSTDDFPFIMGMTPSVNEGPTKPLSIIYDIKRLNNDLFCGKYSLPPLASFGRFIRYANRRIILIHTDVKLVTSQSLHKYMHCGKYLQAIKDFSKTLLKALNAEAKKMRSSPFVFDHACCIPRNNDVIESPSEIAEGCGFSPSTPNISIIFTLWHGYYKAEHSIQPTGKAVRLVVADTPIFRAPSSTTDVFPLSQGIINNASAFANYLSFCNNNDTPVEFVAVHFRTGKLDSSKFIKKDFEVCFDATQLLLNDFDKSCSNCLRKCHRYFVDYGEFGSHSRQVVAGKKMSGEILKQNNIEPDHYDPRKYDGVLDSGFVAQVEQLAIAHSSMLILVGHGSFQEQLLNKFKQLGYGTKVYRVCPNHIKVDKAELALQLLYNRETATLQ